MVRKFKDDYQKKFLIKRRINELGFRYLQVWFYIFALYLFVDIYFKHLLDIVVNNKPLPILDFLVYSFGVSWVLPFSFVYFNFKELKQIEKEILKKIEKQEKRIKAYRGQFNGGYPKTKRYQKKLDRMDNKLVKLQTEYEMSGFGCK